MSICMRCGGGCTCNRHGKIPEKLFKICTKDLEYPPYHKGLCMEEIRKVLDEHEKYMARKSDGMQRAIDRALRKIEIMSKDEVKQVVEDMVDDERALSLFYAMTTQPRERQD